MRPFAKAGRCVSMASRWALLGCVALAHLGCAAPKEKRATITVAAASSLTAAMEEIAALWNDRSEVEVRCTFGSSSTLVNQIERGAPYDMLLSANEYWVGYLVAVDLVDRGEPFLLARNDLVIVEPREDRAKETAEGDALPEKSFTEVVIEGTLFKAGTWALGDPDHVPVGIYAKQALEDAYFWDDVEDRVVPAASARAALRLVERGEVDYGIVYRTDMLGSPLVDAVVVLPHRHVKLVGCALPSAGGDAREFAVWLQGAEAQGVLRRYGFRVDEPAPPVEVK